ncbi:protein of unknown function DUF134 [Lachnospiraceae bacterium KM106-2]|nr:protein of unknown function DUF134 [Lachnospiraceae bacterium KM106-2]
MPRNAKSRIVCAEFKNKLFAPKNDKQDTIVVSVEEIEAIRLCDYEGLNQEEAANAMDVSRGTLQRILYQARAKTAQALSEGKAILINGGNYETKDSNVGCKRNCKRCMLGNKK